MNQAPVIILGGGPVGLSAALELARFGIASILVEKHPSTSWHPKTRNFNTRTMEVAMGWGEAVYRRLRNVDTPPGWKSPIRFLESATGRELGLIESKGFEGPGPDGSPAEPIMSSQDSIEEILLEAIRATGLVDVRFSTRAARLLRGGGEDDEDVALEIEDLATGRVETIMGAALVAADGAASGTRTELGLAMEGPTGLSHLVNCYFRAAIERYLAGRQAVLYFVSNPGATGALQPLDAKGRWLCQINVPAADWSPERFDAARARAWICAAAGVPELEVDVLSLGFWKLNATTIEQFVQGRVVFCGDAAHQFPPTGGLGVNTGIQGMHNAMWKLAAFVKGTASWDLVRSYHDERRPVSREIALQSLENSANVGRITAAAATGSESGLSAEQLVKAARRYGNHLGVEFGAHYRSAAVIPDGTAPPEVADSYSDYRQSATPGCRLPHVWLGEAANRLSTHHLIGAAFTLLANSGGHAWRAAARDAAADIGIRIDCYVIGSAGLADDGGFGEAMGLAEGGAVLVRPDGHVAWRDADGAGADGLADILRRILHR